jgi:hypothetical protein
MKHKPISEGYKFYVVCDSSAWYVYDFFPDGRGDTILFCSVQYYCIDCALVAIMQKLDVISM